MISPFLAEATQIVVLTSLHNQANVYVLKASVIAFRYLILHDRLLSLHRLATQAAAVANGLVKSTVSPTNNDNTKQKPKKGNELLPQAIELMSMKHIPTRPSKSPGQKTIEPSHHAH